MKTFLFVLAFLLGCCRSHIISPQQASIISVNDLNFNSEVLQSEQTVIVDFTSTWCGACKEFAITLQDFADNNPTYKVVKIDVMESPVITQSKHIKSVPTVIIFVNGKETKRCGFLNKDKFNFFVKD
jgi:thioredoxin 1